jgi:hypothetical protein
VVRSNGHAVVDHDVVPYLPTLAKSFHRSLQAGNKSPRAVSTYDDALKQLDDYLEANAMPRVVASIKRGHVEAFIADLLQRVNAITKVQFKSATASNRYRALQRYPKLGGEERDLMRLAGWRSRSMVSRYGVSAAEQRAREADRRLAPGWSDTTVRPPAVDAVLAKKRCRVV